jgi:hypothetical protein
MVTTLLLHFITWLKKLYLEYIVSLMGRKSLIDSKVGNLFSNSLILPDRTYNLCVAPNDFTCHETSFQNLYKLVPMFFFLKLFVRLQVVNPTHEQIKFVQSSIKSTQV